MSMDVEPMRTIDPRETAAAVDGRRSAMEDPRETLTAVDGRSSAVKGPREILTAVDVKRSAVHIFNDADQ